MATRRREPGGAGVLDPPETAPASVPDGGAVASSARDDVPVTDYPGLPPEFFEPPPAAIAAAREREALVRLIIAAAFTVAAVVLTVMHVTGTGVFREAPAISAAPATSPSHAHLLSAIRAIEGHIAVTGRAPESLAPFPFAAEPGWHYERISDRSFVVAFENDLQRVEYDSRRDGGIDRAPEAP